MGFCGMLTGFYGKSTGFGRVGKTRFQENPVLVP